MGSSSLCVVNKSLVVTPLWAGMRTKSKWSPGPGIKVQSVVSNGDGDWVVSACGPSSGICPDCRHPSRSRHGWSYRSLQDLPIQGNEVTVRLQLSRWRCTYRQCKRQTFTEPLPAIASPYARRTRRVAEIVGAAGAQRRRAARRALDETAWDVDQRRHHPSALEAQCFTGRRPTVSSDRRYR
jgi:transposase